MRRLVQAENYFNICGWMLDIEVNGKPIKGAQLMIYAIIYSHSQDGRSVFYGSLEYLAEWIGMSKRQVYNILGELHDAGLIAKEIYFRNGDEAVGLVATRTRKKISISENISQGCENISQGNNKSNNSNIYNNYKKEYTKEHGVHPAQAVVEYLNKKAGRCFDPKTNGTESKIKKLITAGYTVENIMAVIDLKVHQWTGSKVEDRLCPDTLFGFNNFRRYIDEIDELSKREKSESKKSIPFSEPAMKCARYIDERHGILQPNTYPVAADESLLRLWASDIQGMYDSININGENTTWNWIGKVLSFAFRDKFWQGKIADGASFAKFYTKLSAEYEKNENGDS